MEDEDGKEWTVDDVNVLKEAKCLIGTELNSLMEEICENLLDLGYNDDDIEKKVHAINLYLA
jgi:hypothetical protein